MHSARIHHTMYLNVLVLLVCTIQYYYYAYCSTSTGYHAILVASLRGGMRLLRERHLHWQQPACFIWFVKTKVGRDGRFLTIACASSAHAPTSSDSSPHVLISLLCTIQYYYYYVYFSTSLPAPACQGPPSCETSSISFTFYCCFHSVILYPT